MNADEAQLQAYIDALSQPGALFVMVLGTVATVMSVLYGGLLTAGLNW
jgi:hypothetical protein